MTVIRNRHGRVRSGWRLLAFVVALAGAGMLAGAVLRITGLPPQRLDGVAQPLPWLVVGLTVCAVALGVTWLFLRVVEGRRTATLGLPPHRGWVRALLVGFAFGAATPLMLVAGSLLSGHASVSLAAPPPGALLGTTMPIVVGFFLFAGFEELMLRGYPLQMLAEGIGRWPAMAVTGVTFGLLHAGNEGANVLGVANTAVNGVLLAWLVVRSGSLWLAWAYHAGWNVTGATLLGMTLSGSSFPAPLWIVELRGPDWVTGGDYGFEGAALAGVLELAVLSVAVALAGRLPGGDAARPYYDGSALRSPAA